MRLLKLVGCKWGRGVVGRMNFCRRKEASLCILFKVGEQHKMSGKDDNDMLMMLYCGGHVLCAVRAYRAV